MFICLPGKGKGQGDYSCLPGHFSRNSNMAREQVSVITRGVVLQMMDGSPAFDVHSRLPSMWSHRLLNSHYIESGYSLAMETVLSAIQV